jgi:hypothetical protein
MDGEPVIFEFFCSYFVTVECCVTMTAATHPTQPLLQEKKENEIFKLDSDN